MKRQMSSEHQREKGYLDNGGSLGHQGVTQAQSPTADEGNHVIPLDASPLRKNLLETKRSFEVAKQLCKSLVGVWLANMLFFILISMAIYNVCLSTVATRDASSKGPL